MSNQWKNKYAKEIGWFTGNQCPCPESEAQLRSWLNIVSGDSTESTDVASARCMHMGKVMRNKRILEKVRPHVVKVVKKDDPQLKQRMFREAKRVKTFDPTKPPKNYRFMTAAIIFFTGLMATVWDLFVFTRDGVHSTISQVFVDWIASPSPMPELMVGFCSGYLVCHFFGWWMIPGGTQCSKKS